MNETPSENSNGPTRPRLNKWAAIIAVLAGAGAFTVQRSLQFSQHPAPQLTPIVDERAVSNNANAMQMTPAVKSKPIALSIWLPNDEGEVVRKTLGATLPPAPQNASKSEVARAQWMETATSIALRTLMKEAPQTFPSGTQLKSVTWNHGVIETDFNAKFADADFWQGSARTLAGTQSIVNTVDGVRRALGTELSQDLPPVGVQLLVDGKPLQTLGELEVDEPLHAETKTS